jgi:Mrp family chromosome partitioning ATPase
LLIDADLRRPSVHRLIDDDNQAGLSTLLTSQSDLASVIRTTSHANFW